MQVFETTKALQHHLLTEIGSNKTVGFVPTMGALHVGHMSLVKKSLDSSDFTVVSIFVNPTQFNNNSDLEKYPRTLEHDIALIKSISEHVIIFVPTAEDLYAGNVKTQKFDFGVIEQQMEGKYRPGHFDGVGTVLTLLFDAVKPTKAFFGEKDYQQLQIVKKLVALKALDVEIIGCEIYRETSGLAYSSRNERLTAKQRNEAKLLYEILKAVKTNFGTKSVKEIQEMVINEFDKNDVFELEYFEIANAETLMSITEKEPNETYRAFLAVFAGEVRLIDNIALN